MCVHHPKSNLLPSPFALLLLPSTSPNTPFPLVSTILASVSTRIFCFFIQWFYKLFKLKTRPVNMAFRGLCDLALATYSISRPEPRATLTHSALGCPALFTVRAFLLRILFHLPTTRLPPLLCQGSTQPSVTSSWRTFLIPSLN